MACQPTPISTIFSTSTSLIPSTITSSSAIVITPSASVSIWVTTICTTPPAVPQATDNGLKTSSSSISSSTDTLTTSSTDTLSSSSSSSSNDAVLSFGMTSISTDPSITSSWGESPTSPVGQLLETSSETLSTEENVSIPNGVNTNTNSHSQGIRRKRGSMTRHASRSDVMKRQESQEQCETITSTSSILATPTTSWSLEFSTVDSTSLVVVPIETVMGGCESTTAVETTSAVSTTPIEQPISISSTPAATIPPTTSSSIAPVVQPTSSSESLVVESSSIPETSTSTSNLPISSIPSSTIPSAPSVSSISSSVPPSTTIEDLIPIIPSSITESAPSSSPTDYLTAVFTGPTLTSDSTLPTDILSSTSDPLSPIPSDALQPIQSTEVTESNTSETPSIPDDQTPSSISSSSETKAVIPGLRPLQTLSSTKSLASQNSKPTLNHNSSTSPNGELKEGNGEEGETNKGKAAGAAIGGLIALIAIIASILFFIRWWKKKQRAERTRSLRASWFYGEKGVVDGENEKRRSAPAPPIPSIRSMRSVPQISRFSAPSFASRSEGLGALLARPLKSLRRDSSLGLKPLKLVSGDPNEDSTSGQNGIFGKITQPFTGVAEKMKQIPGSLLFWKDSSDTKRNSFIVKSRNISSPQPIDPERISEEDERGIFQSSKLLPIFSKFRSFRQSFKRPFSGISQTFGVKDLNNIRNSKIINDNHSWAEKYKNKPAPPHPPIPTPNIVGEAWEIRNSESDNSVKVNFMQPPPPSATGSNTKHGSMNSDSPYPIVVPGNLNNQNQYGIGTALSPGMGHDNDNDNEFEFKPPTHVQLRHLTWGSSYAPPRTSILSSNGMLIHSGNGGEPSEDGNSIYSRTSLSHGHGSNNIHRNNTIKSNISDRDDLLQPPRSSISYPNSPSGENNNGNVPSPPLAPYLTGHGTFPEGLFSPISAGSNNSRGSFAVLPSLPEYPSASLQPDSVNNTDKQIKDLRRITRSTAHSSGIWEYSAYVDTNSNSNNSQRGSETIQNQLKRISINSQNQSQSRQHQNQGQVMNNKGPMGILKSPNSYSPIPPNSTMMYRDSSSNSPIPIPIHYPTGPSSMPNSNDMPYGGQSQGYNHNLSIQSPRRTSNTPSGRGSLLKHSSLPTSSYHQTEENNLDYNSLPLPLPSRSPQIQIPQRSYTSPSPSTFGHGIDINENERITKAWYDKPLWDGQTQQQQQQLGPQSILMPPRSAGSGQGGASDFMYSQKSSNSIYSKNGGDRASRKSVKSVKSVRWEDEDIGLGV